MDSDEDNTPQQQQEEGETDTGGKKKCSSESDFSFPHSHSSKKAQKREAQCRFYEIQCELEKLKMGAEGDSEESDVAENFCRSKSRAIYKNAPLNPRNFKVNVLVVGNCGSTTINR